MLYDHKLQYVCKKRTGKEKNYYFSFLLLVNYYRMYRVFHMKKPVLKKHRFQDPMSVKPKCVWQVVIYLKYCKQTDKIYFQDLKNFASFENHFGLADIGSKMYRFISTDFSYYIFTIGAPCMKIINEEGSSGHQRNSKTIRNAYNKIQTITKLESVGSVEKYL